MNNALINYENATNLAELATSLGWPKFHIIKDCDKVKKTLNQHLAMGWDARLRVLEMKKECREILLRLYESYMLDASDDAVLTRIERRLKQAQALVNPYK